jgi:hypothetical protein
MPVAVAVAEIVSTTSLPHRLSVQDTPRVDATSAPLERADRGRSSGGSRLQEAPRWSCDGDARSSTATSNVEGAAPTGMVTAVAEGLLDVVEDDLALFLDRARRAGVTPLLLDIVVDATEPAVVRQRAYGRAAAELVHRHGASSPPPGVPSQTTRWACSRPCQRHTFDHTRGD